MVDWKRLLNIIYIKCFCKYFMNDVNFKAKDLTKHLNVLIERVLGWLPAPIAGHGVPPFQECGLTIVGPWAEP